MDALNPSPNRLHQNRKHMPVPACSPTIGSFLCAETKKVPVLIHSFFRNSNVSGAAH